MKRARDVLISAAVVLPLVGVAGCSRGGDASPTAPLELSPPSSAQHRSPAGPWAAPVNLGPVINSAFNDDGPAISRDGLSLYFTSNRSGNSDIWVAQREDKDDPWGAPVNLGSTVNTASIELAPVFSRDGHRMFFGSNRAGGVGGVDIWVSFRKDEDDDFGWQTPVNLGAPVNSPFNDAGPGWLRVGRNEFLFISTNRASAGAGFPDIWVSARRKNGSFGAPVPVTELNTPSFEARAALRRDGRELFFFSNRGSPNPLNTDLWTSTREDRDEPWSAPVNLGPVVNSSSAEVEPALSRDARTLFFASNRLGGSGMFDLYMVTREERDDDDNDDDNDDDHDDD